MGPVLLREETGVPGENLQWLVESNRTISFSYVTKVTLIRQLHGAGIIRFVTEVLAVYVYVYIYVYVYNSNYPTFVTFALPLNLGNSMIICSHAPVIRGLRVRSWTVAWQTFSEDLRLASVRENLTCEPWQHKHKHEHRDTAKCTDESRTPDHKNQAKSPPGYWTNA